MATTFESISLAGLRLAHLRQLQSYVHTRDETGWYYGPKDQLSSKKCIIFKKKFIDLYKYLVYLSSYNIGDKNGIYKFYPK